MALFETGRPPGETKYFVMKAEDLGQIVAAIPPDYRVIGPVKVKWAINFEHIKSPDDLATGFSSNDRPGIYRLTQDRDSKRLSGDVAMNSPKWFTTLPRQPLYKTKRRADGSGQFEPAPAETVKQAFIGVSACDVSGMYVLDRTFQRQYKDPTYDARRRDNIIIGQDCFEPRFNCFCSTYNTGPDLKGGFDVGLAYFGDEYLAWAATEAGARILAQVDTRPAPERMLEERSKKLDKARRAMVKAFDHGQGMEILNANYDHPYWEEPSARCLSCANCINVCPTCYCYQMVDRTEVDGSESRRSRVWDACQILEFAGVHGGNFRPNRIDRLRHWVNHKINWTVEQYGCAGCVGCGRCITWCPTGIDISEPVWRLGGRSIDIAA